MSKRKQRAARKVWLRPMLTILVRGENRQEVVLEGCKAIGVSVGPLTRIYECSPGTNPGNCPAAGCSAGTAS